MYSFLCISTFPYNIEILFVEVFAEADFGTLHQKATIAKLSWLLREGVTDRQLLRVCVT